MEFTVLTQVATNRPRTFQIEAYEEMLQQRVQAFSVLDRIWEKVPAVSEEEAHTDIEQAIAEARAEKTRKVCILSNPVHPKIL